MSRTKQDLAAEWEQDFGDHEECPVCGAQCRDAFMGSDLTPAQRVAQELLQTLKEIERWHRNGITRYDLGRALDLIEKAESHD